MEKLVYLLWKREVDAIDGFRARLLEDAAPKIVADGALTLVATHRRLGLEGAEPV